MQTLQWMVEEASTSIKDYVIANSMKIQLDNHDLDSTSENFVTVAMLGQETIAVFNMRDSLVLSFNLFPPFLIKGKSYNQLTVDQIFSMSNLWFTVLMAKVFSANHSQEFYSQALSSLQQENQRLHKTLKSNTKTVQFLEQQRASLQYKILNLENRGQEHEEIIKNHHIQMIDRYNQIKRLRSILDNLNLSAEKIAETERKTIIEEKTSHFSDLL